MDGGGSSQQPSTTTSTQTSAPWAGQEPHLKFGYEQAQQQFQGDQPQYFPGSTVAPFDPATVQAQNMTMGRAQAGNPLLPAAQGQLQSTLAGNYMNPDLSGVASSIDEQIRPRVGAQFGNAGRLGSPAHQGTYTSAMTNAMAPYAFNANQGERNRMMGAAQMAPGLAQADYGDIDRMAGVGVQREQMGQANLEDEINRFNFGQNVDAQKLAEYMALVGGGSPGGTTTGTSTQPVYRGK
jgi:hypothetical protein